ncbi:MAG: hypothetical protein VYA30_16685 [Myxococcota bacterium]|nr:hypothetical protein [Myxococcota bacterium]
MGIKRSETYLALFCALSLTVWGCDSSSDDRPAMMATGGNAGQGGSGGTGGSGGGDASSDAGDTTAENGDMGTTGGSGGSAGTGGTGGGGGLVLPDDYQLCQERCEADDDCLDGHTCNDGVCTQNCGTDRDCIAIFSAWIDSCETDSDCPGGTNGTQACINYDGLNACAIIPNDFIGCDTLTMAELELNRADGTGAIRVCVQDRAACDGAGNCAVPCGNDSHCLGDYPSCDVESGRCKCTADSCQTNGTLCGDDGFCRCRNDGECTTGPVDVCIDGFCGCSGDAVCEGSQTAHPGTTLTCSEP